MVNKSEIMMVDGNEIDLDKQIEFARRCLKIWNGFTTMHLQKQSYYIAIIESLERLQKEDNPLIGFRNQVKDDPEAEMIKFT